MQLPSPKTLFCLMHYIHNKSCTYLGCIRRNPHHAELCQKVGACVRIASGDILEFTTISNCRKALIWIPFTVKRIIKCLCFRLRNKYKFSLVTIFFLEWNRPSRIFLQKRLGGRHWVTLGSGNIMTLKSHIEHILCIIQFRPQSALCT